MNMQMCNNGHFYDADVHAECPACNRPSEEAVFPKTAPVNSVSTEFPKTAPMNASPTEFPKTAPIGSVPKTAPIGGVGQTPSFSGWNPILGWLVCVQGGKQGKDFRLTQETNYIGRAASNDVCLDFDETISRDTTLTITYIKQSRVFRLNTEQSRNPVMVNGSPMMTELYLRDRDVISVGNTQLKLICFCDASFAWEN